VRFIREDIRGSIAHARMLGKQGIISPEDAAELEQRIQGYREELAERP